VDEGGIISPGGIGYDINCGVRLLVANMDIQELAPHMKKLAHQLARKIPSGVGRGGKLDFNAAELDRFLHEGAARMVELGYGDTDLMFANRPELCLVLMRH
jgi:tRNA-splicing ligase RtcB